MFFWLTATNTKTMMAFLCTDHFQCNLDFSNIVYDISVPSCWLSTNLARWLGLSDILAQLDCFNQWKPALNGREKKTILVIIFIKKVSWKIETKIKKYIIFYLNNPRIFLSVCRHLWRCHNMMLQVCVGKSLSQSTNFVDSEMVGYFFHL